MLNRLYVKNYVLIDSLEVDFPEGLIIITGQTGAGKSILLGALSLIMGSKADSEMISAGADTCVVEAEFSVDASNSSLRQELEENDVEWDNGQLIIRRVLSRTGRSRSFVNDSPVPVSLLQSISSSLIDVHSQHQTRLLSDKQFQLSVLDHFAGNKQLKSHCQSVWHKLNGLKSELAQAQSKLEKLSVERDYNETQFRQLDAAALVDGELEELEIEQRQLANAEEIKNSLGYAEVVFSGSGEESQSVTQVIKEIQKSLQKVSKFIPQADELAERLNSCRMELDDIMSDVQSLNSATDLSESRLEEVESRMSLLYGLMQKHGCRTIAELIELKDRYSSALFDSTQLEEIIGQLKVQVDDAQAELREVSDRLHESRSKAAPEFAKSICNLIRDMELPYAVFEAEITQVPLSSTGYDQVVYRFSATGKGLADVAKCASGGELSRIMLALKSMMARYTNMPTMVFDEIDTGVSGSVADKMGSVICSMCEYMQVFAITHLPQVAAKGRAHYLVSKDIDPVSADAVSKIERLSDEQRVLELARMLSGAVLTDEAIANAKSLLG